MPSFLFLRRPYVFSTSSRAEFGSALARVFASRGVVLSESEAASLTGLLLDLAVTGVLRPGCSDSDMPAAVHQDAGHPSPQGSFGRRPVVRCGPGPIVYNMGPAIHRVPVMPHES